MNPKEQYFTDQLQISYIKCMVLDALGKAGIEKLSIHNIVLALLQLANQFAVKEHVDEWYEERS